MPRHSPCALNNLTYQLSIHFTFRCQPHSFNQSRTEVRSFIYSIAA
ncbi:hypothetical protein Bsph_0012 [Lysinibacillus sphaericus C3-41]|uniref:Uncharacterized protein n=1 Tax=Lysinibacillus sphaericus (strain C3-41) TaxID=444177 RepID=B1HS39_LYSSC|nr:hypothetical protein Bsph_0012 [Lysinibacillus sphaericus C3-41]